MEIFVSLLVILSFTFYINCEENVCVGLYCSEKAKYGILTRRNFEANGEILHLVSVGMRSKIIIFVTNINVYTIAVYTTKKKEKLLRASKTIDSFETSLPNPIDENISLAICLCFERTVEKIPIVNAIAEALNCDDTLATEKFKQILLDSIGKSISKGEEISFLWKGLHGAQSLAIYVRGNYVGSVSSDSLLSRLAAVYLGKNAVSLEVIKNLKTHFSL